MKRWVLFFQENSCSIFRHTWYSFDFETIFALKTTLKLIVKLWAVWINFSASVIKQVTANRTFSTVRIYIFRTKLIKTKCWENALIIDQKVTSNTFVTLTTFSIIRLAFDILWETESLFQIKSCWALNTFCLWIVLVTVLYLRNAYFLFTKDVTVWTTDAFSVLRVECLALIGWVVCLTETIISNEISWCTCNAICKVFW